MSRTSYRSYVVVASLLLSACLENVTVGRETQPLFPGDSGATQGDGGALPSDAGQSGMDGGFLVDAGPFFVDAGPCVPADCQAVQDPATVQKAPTADCPTGEPKVCTRDETGVCGLQCPDVPLEQQCYSPVQIATSDSGACPAGQFCRYGLEVCGGGIGACAPIPTDCNEPEEQVCGCDGVNYPNLCAAFQAGISPRSIGKCP